MGYLSKAEFIRTETRISSWEEQAFGNVITTLTMLSLKRNSDEKEEQDGFPLQCRFLDCCRIFMMSVVGYANPVVTSQESFFQNKCHA